MSKSSYHHLPKLSQMMIPQGIIQPLIVFLFLGILVDDILEENYLREKQEELRLTSKLIEEPLLNLLEKNKSSKNPNISLLCKKIANTTNTRITIILENGFVLGDSHKNPEVMDNHINRPEVIQALNNSVGTSRRFSDSVNEKMFYFASIIPFENSKLIVRTSFPDTQLKEVLNSARIKLGALIILAVSISGITIFIIGRRIVKPLEEIRIKAERFSEGEFSSKISKQSTFEFGNLAESFNKMSKDLKKRIDRLNEEKNEKTTLISSMVEGLALINSQGKIKLTNQSFLKILKINEPEQNIVNKDFRKVIFSKKLIKIIKLSINTGKSNQFDLNIDKKINSFVQITISPIRELKNKKFDIILVMNDISRLMLLERVRKDFVSNVSHELKTPLTVINGYLETLQNKSVVNPDQKKIFLKTIESNSRRMGSIIDDLLMLSKIESQAEEESINKIITPIKPLLNSSLDDIISKYGNIKEYENFQLKNNINLDCDENLSFSLNIELMRQAISNLIDNAIKYGGLNSNINIKAHIKIDNLHISVKNTGSFIKKDFQTRLFERFYRVDKGRSRNKGGTGLGLAIVKHIALAHNGYVAVESKESDGTCFTIKIPKET